MRSSSSRRTERAAEAAAADGSVTPSESAAGQWLRIEVDQAALRHNMAQFRARIAPGARLMAVVKADAYGHGLLLASRAFLSGGADVLGVHSLAELRLLRRGDIKDLALVLGPLTAAEVADVASLEAELTVASVAAATAVAQAARQGARCRVHLKVETGVHRQGIDEKELPEVLACWQGLPVELVGISSHFADIEDTTDHAFARRQMARFADFLAACAESGHCSLCRHMSCSASAILFAQTHHDMVRVGIAGYGIWPSRETLVSARALGQNQLDLKPALSWKCRVAQVKDVPAGETVGYGRTWKAPAASRIAILPVGYADGYPRLLSGQAHVLIRGQRAAVRGRICMNLSMVDVTHIAGAAAGDDAVLLGRQQEETITAEQLAQWLNTIPYEVLTLPGATWTRAAG